MISWKVTRKFHHVIPRRFANFRTFYASTQRLLRVIPCKDLLSEVRENKQMQEKLLEWVVREWARIAADHIKVGPFPSFEVFVKFLASEADIACNPCIFSRSDKSEKSGKTRKSQGRHHVLATSSTEKAALRNKRQNQLERSKATTRRSNRKLKQISLLSKNASFVKSNIY